MGSPRSQAAPPMGRIFASRVCSTASSCGVRMRMPVCLDLPMLDTVIVEVPNPHHPYGVRGVGETSVIPTLAAITNAVSHAIGIRLNQLPLSPARILEALWEKEAATNVTHRK